MTVKSSYVFGASFALAAAGVFAPHAGAALATTAAFTFETTGTALVGSVTSPAIGPLLAESGVGTAYASHAATGTVYSSPAGSGSARSLSANNFLANDYWQFDVPTSLITDILVGFDAVSSGTGPKVFQLSYSTGGGVYTAFSNYTLNSGTTTAFATSATNPAVHFAFDLSGITALNTAPLASFRLVDVDTTTATGGTSRVDNFTVAGNSVPEPATLSAAALALAAFSGRRRK